MKKEFQLTQDGVQELQAELEELKKKLVEVVAAIKTARDQGDLKENAEYHAAKEDQERVDSRLKEIEHILLNTEVVTHAPKNTVSIGNAVTLKSGAKESTYYIVDSIEVDPIEMKISDESPIGKAIMGKKVGATVEIKLPVGTKKYEIVKIG